MSLYHGAVQYREDQTERVKRTFRLTLPPILMDVRGMNTRDAEHVLKIAPSELLYPLAHLLGIPIPISSISISPMNRYSTTFNRAIMNKIATSPAFARETSYTELHDSIIPFGSRLPVVSVDHNVFKALIQSVPASWSPRVPVTGSTVWHSRDGRVYMPLLCNERMIMASRVVSDEIYELLGYNDFSLVNQAPLATLDGQAHRIMTDDSILLMDHSK
jgi:hypothetical protein